MAARTHVRDEKIRGRSSVITEDLVQTVDGKVPENRRFTISSLSKTGARDIYTPLPPGRYVTRRQLSLTLFEKLRSAATLVNCVISVSLL
ncbi:hypothetical protein AVEN_225323-1 [Araneus ventricosus]|uniref:Uncharacterized protein n=1 Tax=Araneus ventricosus TaxID=182803 RepID=A0A4Y2ALN9_ARAVE|nr:hypothetical protein AVEN_225323-1 [Araneus ventricosus]